MVTARRTRDSTGNVIDILRNADFSPSGISDVISKLTKELQNQTDFAQGEVARLEAQGQYEYDQAIKNALLPTTFSSELAKPLGVTIPQGWNIKITPALGETDTEGNQRIVYSETYIGPDGKVYGPGEIVQLDNGQWISRADWTVLQQQYESAATPQQPAEVTQAPLYDPFSRETLQKRLDLAVALGDASVSNVTEIANWLFAPGTDEEIQQRYADMATQIVQQGRGAETERVLRVLFPAMTDAQMEELWAMRPAITVPLAQIPFAEYKLTDQYLPDLIEMATTSPDQLRAKFLFDGRSPETEDLLRQIYGGDQITEKYLDDYFQDNLPGKFVRGDWLPEGLQDYWSNYWAGVGDLTYLLGGAADRLGWDSVGDTLKRLGLEGQLIAIDGSDPEPDTPQWYVQNLIRMVPAMLGIIDVALATGGAAASLIGAAGGGAFLQGLGAAVIGGVSSAFGEGVLEGGDAYNQALQQGMSQAEANAVFDKVLRNNMALLSASNTAQFAATFVIPGGKATSFFIKALTFGFDAASEAAEEGIQTGIQRAALGEENPWRFDEQMLQSIKLGAAGGFAFAGVGSVYNIVKGRIQERMTPVQQEQFLSDKAAGLLRGMTEQQAESHALDQFASTKEGATIINDVASQALKEDLNGHIEDIKKVDDALSSVVDAHEINNTRIDKLVQDHLPQPEPLPQAAPGEPEPGLQAGMFGENRIVRPEGRGQVTQVSMDEAAQLEEQRRQQREYEDQVTLETLKEELANDPAAKFTDFIKRSGKNKGELNNLTIAQWKRLGNELREPSPNILTKDGKHVRWEHALDEKAPELGYSSDEAFRDAIFHAWETKQKIRDLTRQLKANQPAGMTPEETAAPASTEAQASPEDIEIERQLGELQKMADIWRARQQNLDTVRQTLYTIAKGMPLEIRGKMLAALKNVRNEKHLDIAVGRIGQLVEQYQSKTLKTKLSKLLNRTKAKAKRGILKGNLTPEIQTRLDIIRRNFDADRDEARLKMADNIAKYEAGELSYDEMLMANEILDFNGIKNMTLSELEATYDYVNSLVEYGRAVRTAKREEEAARIGAVKDGIIGVISGGRGLKESTGAVPPAQLEETKGWLEKLVNWQYSWDNFMDKLSKFDKSAPYKSRLSQFGNIVHQARNRENSGIETAMSNLRQSFQDAYGVKGKRIVNNLLNQLRDEEINLGTFRNLDGTEVNLKLTKDQLISKYQQLQDPTLDRTFEEGMRWNQEMKDAVVNNLSEKDVKWADAIMRFYQDYYQSVNKVYSDIFGVDMPRNFNYSPVRREVETELPENQLVYRDLSQYASVTSGSLMARTHNKIPLKYNGATELLIDHVQQMEHFKGWAEAIRDLRRVFQDTNVRTAIRQYHGGDILKTLDGYINDMARGGIEKAKINRGADMLRRNFTRAILGVKPAISIKQIPSIVAYMTEMPIQDFVSGVASYWAHPLDNFNFLKEHSTNLRQRWGAGYERDVKAALEHHNLNQFSGKGNWRDYFMTLIRLGDRLATVQGAWAKYQYELKHGATEADAILAAEQLTNRTQPSSDLETLSPLQKGGSFLKLLTMFQNQPNKYFRILGDNIRNFQYGRGSRAKAASNIMLAWVVAPAIFQFIADAFQWDTKHQLRAWVLGPVNWMLIFGQFAQSTYGWVTGEPFDYQASPVLQSTRDIQGAIQKAISMYNKGQDPTKDVTVDDMAQFIEYIAKAAGQIAGIPTSYLVQVERQYRRGGDLKGLIFSEYALNAPDPTDNEKANEALKGLGMPTDTERPLSTQVDIYDMNQLDIEMRKLYGDKLPDDILADPDAPAEAKAWVTKERYYHEALTLPNIALYQVNTDLEKDDTIVQYYEQWKARQEIDNLADLKEFDKLYPHAFLGNVTRRQYTLMVDYLNAEDKAQFLEDHPELKVNPRNEWLVKNPEANAYLAIFGDAKIMTMDAYNKVQSLIKELDIPDSALPPFTVPGPAAIQQYFKYNELGDEFGWNSWEIQLLLAQNEPLRSFLGRDMPETPVTALELQIKNRELSEQYAGFADKESHSYLPSVPNKEDPDYRNGREYAREQFREQHPEWVDDMRRVDAIVAGGTDSQAESWVERGHIIDQYGSSSSEAKKFLIDHPDIHKWALANGLITDKGDDWNKAVIELNVKWAKNDDDYAALTTTAERKDYLDKHPEYRDDRLRRDAYLTHDAAGNYFPESQVENYVSYYQMPARGFRQERFLIENPEFAQAMHTMKGLDIPDEGDIPSVRFDEIYEQYQRQFDQYEGAGDYLSQYYIEDQEKRAEARAELFKDRTFRRAYYERRAYGEFVPEQFVQTYTDWFMLPTKKDAEARGAQFWQGNYYEDDWFLMEHLDFYRMMINPEARGDQAWERRDFTRVPPRELMPLLLQYQALPGGRPRLDFRLSHENLEDWFVKVLGYTPAEGRSYETTQGSPWDIYAQGEGLKQGIIQDFGK